MGLRYRRARAEMPLYPIASIRSSRPFRYPHPHRFRYPEGIASQSPGLRGNRATPGNDRQHSPTSQEVVAVGIPAYPSVRFTSTVPLIAAQPPWTAGSLLPLSRCSLLRGFEAKEKHGQIQTCRQRSRATRVLHGQQATPVKARRAASLPAPPLRPRRHWSSITTDSTNHPDSTDGNGDEKRLDIGCLERRLRNPSTSSNSRNARC
jgi:hypothetical protein